MDRKFFSTFWGGGGGGGGGGGRGWWVGIKTAFQDLPCSTGKKIKRERYEHHSRDKRTLDGEVTHFFAFFVHSPHCLLIFSLIIYGLI